MLNTPACGRPCRNVTPVNGAMTSHATTIRPIPMKHNAVDVCSIRVISAPPGKSSYGLFITGIAPAPNPPNPNNSAPNVPNHRKNANRRSSENVSVGSWYGLLRDRSGPETRTLPSRFGEIKSTPVAVVTSSDACRYSASGLCNNAERDPALPKRGKIVRK